MRPRERRRLASTLPGAAILAILATSAILAVSPGPAAAQTAVPADLVNPRTVLDTFLAEQLRSEPDWTRVTATIAFGADTPVASRREIASRLKSILDARGLFVRMDAVPSDPEHVDEDSRQSRFRPFPIRLPDFIVARGPDSAWRIAAHTVASADHLYEETFSWYARRLLEALPPVFERSFYGFTLWQATGLLLLAGIAWGAQALLRILFASILTLIGRRRSSLVARTLERAALPASWIASVFVFHRFLSDLRFPVRVSQAFTLLTDFALAAFTIWLAFRLIDGLYERIQAFADRTENQLDDHLAPLARTALRVGAVLVAVLLLAESQGYSVTTLVAGLGLGGLAVALAAQDTLANVIGSLAIVGDRPFQVGDWILVGEHEGTVERVGLRSTRVRTFYDSLVSVPNAKVVNSVVDNMGQRTYRRIRRLLPLRYDTDPDRIHAFVEGIRAIVRANPAMRQDVYEVHLNQVSEHSVDVLLYCFFKVPDWHNELVERHNFLLQILRLARELGIEFAVPARTLQLESTPDAERGPPRPDERPDPEHLRAVVASFGPGGRFAPPAKKGAGSRSPPAADGAEATGQE